MAASKIINGLALALLLFFCWLMARLSLPYVSLRYDVDFLLTKQKIIHIAWWRYAFYLHVFLSIFTLVAGFTQFSNYLLRHHRRIHRLMGYVYVSDILLLAGPAALIMSFYANGTQWSKLSFVLLSVLWMSFTAIALAKARNKDFASHKRWMIRSYALTLSAISLRLYALILPAFIHLNAVDAYTLIAWCSWTINLLIAELIIFKKRNSLLIS